MVDVEVYDDTEVSIVLIEIADACSRCASRAGPLVALVWFVRGDISTWRCAVGAIGASRR
jgi:hypothetical protein